MTKAGCNFSAISGADFNALKWDHAGYLYLSKLADNPTETFVRRTPSTELWDEAVPHDKIKAMSEYLEDVCYPTTDTYAVLTFLTSDLVQNCS